MNRRPRVFPFRQARRRGIALVLVLAMIILLTALVVGLMLRASSELKSSTNYTAAASARQLSDVVVNLVQAQINDATTQGSTNAWASQPGAIRLWDKTGSLLRIYKLYSAVSLVATDPASISDDIPDNSDWTNSPAVWRDINAPVTFSGTAGTSTNLAYPVLDATAASTIDGFAVTNAPGVSSNQPAPMPVRWLYVLQNGEVVAPAGSGNTVTVSGASASNPIVGRVAFWTDDDTCKVNVNTAGDGAFWDTPHFDVADEKTRARFQPAQGEFQAYPGHPATTSLTNILGTNALNISPRYTYGGSKGGTAVASTNLPWKGGRLYSSVGELLFSTNMISGARLTNGPTRQRIESSRFFLTARSRAPEVNLFGKPRISIWPLHSTNSSTYRTPTDRLIAFCSTVNGRAYYFMRENPTSATVDINLTRNVELLDYLDKLTSTSIPGFGSDFRSKYALDQRQILTEIFDYIRIGNLRDSTVPMPYSRQDLGTSTYPGAPDLGSLGQVIPSYKANWNTRGFGRFPVLSEATLLFTGAGRGVTTPPPAPTPIPSIPVDAEQAPGYTPSTPSSLAPPVAGTPPDNTTAMQSFLLLSFFNPTYGWSGMQLGFSVKVTGLGGITVQSGTNAAVGLGLRDGSLSFAGRSTTDFYHGRDFGFVDVRAVLTYKRKGDPTPYQYNYTRTLGSNPLTQFPFYGNIVEVANPSGTMAVTGANIQISVYSGQNTADESKLIQRYNMDLPTTGTMAARIPTVPPHPTSDPGSGGRAPWMLGVNSSDSFKDRVDTWWLPGSITTSDNGPYVINTKFDTAISTVPTGLWTDYRLFALYDGVTAGIPSSAFATHPGNAAASNQGIRYGLKLAAAGNFPDALSGNLVPSISKQANWDNVVSVHLNGAFAGGSAPVPGDWDNGMGKDNAGPYINKPDEGNVYNISSATPYFDDDQNFASTGPTFFSPNRQIQSPVMFGSLPSGSKAMAPWQTLLFRPGPTGHKGMESPRDHLLLDLFWMPVAEPYAISEPLSTAGKINMNYQILPFGFGNKGYLTRSTGIRAVLAGIKTAKVGTTLSNPARRSLNLGDKTGTLRQFREKFENNDIFKSATEICDIFLVPDTDNWGDDVTARSTWYGNAFARVGDNVRERPYADIYPRLTTKSNVYTVHYTVQALRGSSTNPSQWTESNNRIAGEYRGSTTLERYLDPNDIQIPDYADPSTPAGAPTLDTFYRWRIIENQQFAP